MIKRLFNCPKCAKQPDKDFVTYEKFNDWWIAYPEENLLHIHYGKSTPTEEENTKENESLRDFLLNVLNKYDDKQFFLLADLGTLDNSDSVSTDSMKIFISILKNKQIAGLSVYGAATGFNMLVKSLVSMFSKVSLVNDYKDADDMYHKWFSEYKK